MDIADDFSYTYKTYDENSIEDVSGQISGGAICLCMSGTAEIQIGTKKYSIEKMSEIILLSEITMFITGCSAGFRLQVFSFSRKMSFQAMRKFDPLFFRHISNHPLYRHKNQETYNTSLSYMSIISDLQKDQSNRFNVIIATNLLRSLMLNIYDKILRYDSNNKKDIVRTRKEMVFDKFIALINETGQSHRDVAWYADRLCISPRYLNSIVREVADEYPKEIIDRHIILEIKMLLTFSDLSMQEIADRLNFPDQSYMGRFFRRATGVSPLAYRKQEIPLIQA
ncbi:MAG: helix-turn-helix domain-containing protein [Candidatus Cryptobacteroides sp.]